MIIGPLEFVVIGINGHQFSQEIAPELKSIQEQGHFRVIDLLFARKDANGTVSVLEVHDLNDAELAPFDPFKQDLVRVLTPEDIALLTSPIPPNTSAVIVLLEHLWTVRLAQKIQQAGATLLAGGMVPPAAVEKLEAELAASQEQQPS